jgi:hypothetical protein
MPRHHLIEGYLDGLRVLPADVVKELTDGLVETYDHHCARGRAPDEAARAAITEFGTTDQILGAFDEISPGRRASRLLLAMGPLVGLCWGTALLTSRAWAWPIPPWAPPVLGVGLVTVIVLLLVGARGRRTRRAASLGAGGLVLLDAFVITGVFAVAPAVAWPLLLAMLASVVRACLTARTLPGILTCAARK